MGTPSEDAASAAGTTDAEQTNLATGTAGTTTQATANPPVEGLTTTYHSHVGGDGTNVEEVNAKDAQHVADALASVPDGVTAHPNLAGGQADQGLVVGQAPKAPASPQKGSPAYGHNHDGVGKGVPGQFQSAVVRQSDDPNEAVGDEFEGKDADGISRNDKGQVIDPSNDTQKATTKKA